MRVKVLSHFLFDEDMKRMGLNDGNVEDSNMAFISIIGTPNCLKYYLDEEDTKHYFSEGHPNVLNLDFDDIDCNVLYNGHLFETMTMTQAELSVDFIEEQIKNGVETIEIHCRAGLSRSRSFGEFIYRYCKEHDVELEYEDRDDYTTILNHGVLRRLNHAYWKKHKLEFYKTETEYPLDLIQPYLEVINRERKPNKKQ